MERYMPEQKKPEKSLPRTALPRIYFIDREIAAGTYPNTVKLAKAYETSVPTISRDIEFMRDMLEAPIEYDYQHKGYYYAEKTFRLPAAFTSANDMLALGMAKTLLSLYRNTPIHEAASHLLESITAPLEDRRNPEWYEDRIIVPPAPSVPIAPEIWHIICESLRENRILTFEYRSAWYEDYQIRRVHPWQLLFDNGSWYLYAWSEERSSPRMFSLSRMRQLIFCAETFNLPKNHDFRTRNEGSYFGVYSSEKKRRYRIAFYGDAAMRIQERQWAADQVIEENADGIVISFTSSQYGKALELALANGGDALPLEPAELVEEWRDNLKKMEKREKTDRKSVV
jgi:predicted DNA-binding transcriptional regulator YafY